MSAAIGLSTTLATNAIVEGTRRRVLGILIGYGPDDFPPALREDAVLIRGGHDVRGEEREPLDSISLPISGLPRERIRRGMRRERGDGSGTCSAKVPDRSYSFPKRQILG
ncbi:MAG: hypothetical protein AABZ85_04810 [Thermodesulfobacteriota bacterium]